MFSMVMDIKEIVLHDYYYFKHFENWSHYNISNELCGLTLTCGYVDVIVILANGLLFLFCLVPKAIALKSIKQLQPQIAFVQSQVVQSFEHHTAKTTVFREKKAG